MSRAGGEQSGVDREDWGREEYYTGPTPPRTFRSFLVSCLSEVAALVAKAADDLVARNDDGGEHLDTIRESLLLAATHLSAAAGTLAERDVGRPFRVVLMGRTMAGKSTLFEYLTVGDGTRVGAGGQRTTRDICVRQAARLDGIEVVDTPGVGAMDGREDYEAAFAEVGNADLIVWVATDQATQEQTGQALERLASLGKPLVVALNCLADVTNENNLLDLLEEPDRVFGGDAEGNLAPIRRHLSRAGGQYLQSTQIHAQAAQTATQSALDGKTARELHKNSRVDSLIHVLVEQRDRTAQQRRAVSLADVASNELLETSAVLAESATLIRATEVVVDNARRAFATRASRRIGDAGSEIRTAFVVSVAARERWIADVDVDLREAELSALWHTEVQAIDAEAVRAFTDVQERLAQDLRIIAADVTADWVRLDTGTFQSLPGRAPGWGNRAFKVGGRAAIALGTTVVGARLGTAVGKFIPGPGPVVGSVAGGAIGLIGGFLGLDTAVDRIGDKLFRSDTQIRERRRQKVREQFTPLLSQLGEDLIKAADEAHGAWRAALEAEVARQTMAAAALDRAATTLERIVTDGIEPATRAVDTELGRELLRVVGLRRAATAVLRATRRRGVGIAVDLPEPVFSETVLSPLPETVERILPIYVGGSPGARALKVLHALTDQAVTVRRLRDGDVVVEVDAALPLRVREAWAALAQVHTGATVQITTKPEGARDDDDDSGS